MEVLGETKCSVQNAALTLHYGAVQGLQDPGVGCHVGEEHTQGAHLTC